MTPKSVKNKNSVKDIQKIKKEILSIKSKGTINKRIPIIKEVHPTILNFLIIFV